jgi:ABC-type multidrug transport system fused ATPase/permease subunit
MAILTNPVLIETNIYLKVLYQYSGIFGVENNNDFIFFVGIIMFTILMTSLSVKALAVYLQVNFVQKSQFNLSKRLVKTYLYHSYDWFLNNNSADLGKTILSEVAQIIGNSLNPLIELVTKGLITILILFLLIIVDPILALVVGTSLGVSYGIIFYFVNNFIKSIGKERLKNNELRFLTISEAFGAIKEIKVGGLEKRYIDRFSIPAKNFAQNQASAALVSQLPRYFMEAIVFGGIMLMIFFFMSQSRSFNEVIPIISLYVFAGYRLMPALQQIYASASQIIFTNPSVEAIFDDIKNHRLTELNQSKNLLVINNSIVLKNIYYSYPNASKVALKNINLNIFAKTIVGITGPTGSGKTTIVDIMLGLLEPQKGSLEIDDKVINNINVRAWQSNIGYVPQNIYLIDDTISANIALGKDTSDINHAAVEKAAKIANLHDFIINDCPNKYSTTVGERGIRLSGGQRQRIGIARALYNNPQVLILDEATSSLDNLTEQVVMDAINNLEKSITIIIIAHRLNTLKKCDKIFLLEKGEIKNQCTYKELINSNSNIKIKAFN